MKQRYHRLACLFLGIFPYGQINAQNEIPDSGWIRLSKINMTSEYFNQVRENAPFYNGTEYTGYGQNIDGHPFFEIDSLEKGSLYYDGTLFQDIPMLYDLVSDEVIIKDYTNNYFIRLSRSKIRYFILRNHMFIRGEPENNTTTAQNNGFYDRIYEGPSTVFVKRRKQINHTVTSEKTISKYAQYDAWWVKGKDGYVRVSGKQSLLSLLSDKKTELRKWLSNQKFNFKKDMENALQRTVAYYDELKKS